MGFPQGVKDFSKTCAKLVGIYALFLISAFVTVKLSEYLKGLPFIGISEERYNQNATAYMDQSLTLALLGTWCIVGLFAVWIKCIWNFFAKVGAVLEESAVALIGGMTGVAVAVGYYSIITQGLGYGVIVIGLCAFIRHVAAKETDAIIPRIAITLILLFIFYLTVAKM